MKTTRVTAKGQVTLPKEVRQKLGLHAGTRLEVRLRGASSIGSCAGPW